METIGVTRAYRVTLGPTAAQESLLASHAGAARWAFNTALSAKIASREVWEESVARLVEDGVPEDEARKQVKVRTPRAGVIDKARVRVRGSDRHGNPCRADWQAAADVLIAGNIDPEVTERILTRWAARVDDPASGIAPWLAEVPNGLVQRAQVHSDKAWQAWLDSFAGRRAGRRVGFPRFKKRGVRDSFYLTNTEAGPVQGSNRRVRLGGKLGEVAVVDADGKRALRRLGKRIRKGTARVMAVTVSRGGRRWYASILVTEQVPAPVPSQAMRAAGTVGVHLGVRERAVLSTGEVVENPLVRRRHARAVVKAQQALARTSLTEAVPAGVPADVRNDLTAGGRQRSRRREKARARLAHLQHVEALRRGTHTHHLSKRIASGWEHIAMLDLGVQDMTRAPHRCRPPLHGWDARAKRDANGVVLDLAPFEVRRQVEYKSSWRGGVVTVVDRGTPIVGVCSGCGAVRSKPPAPGHEFVCPDCGWRAPRGENAARVLAGVGAAARNKQEALTARGEDVRPAASRGGRRSPMKREGPPAGGSPPRSNPGTFPPRT
jgi:putative transposase